MHHISKTELQAGVKPMAGLSDAEFRQIFRATVYGRRHPIDGMIVTPKGRLAVLRFIDEIDASDITMTALLRHLIEGVPGLSSGKTSDAEFRSAFRATVESPPSNLDDEAILVMLGMFDADDGVTPENELMQRCFLMMQGGGDAH